MYWRTRRWCAFVPLLLPRHHDVAVEQGFVVIVVEDLSVISRDVLRGRLGTILRLIVCSLSSVTVGTAKVSLSKDSLYAFAVDVAAVDSEVGVLVVDDVVLRNHGLEVLDVTFPETRLYFHGCNVVLPLFENLGNCVECVRRWTLVVFEPTEELLVALYEEVLPVGENCNGGSKLL